MQSHMRKQVNKAVDTILYEISFITDINGK
jgi:hypothetical protein